jgi:hypothetical protein
VCDLGGGLSHDLFSESINPPEASGVFARHGLLGGPESLLAPRKSMQ